MPLTPIDLSQSELNETLNKAKIMPEAETVQDAIDKVEAHEQALANVVTSEQIDAAVASATENLPTQEDITAEINSATTGKATTQSVTDLSNELAAQVAKALGSVTFGLQSNSTVYADGTSLITSGYSVAGDGNGATVTKIESGETPNLDLGTLGDGKFTDTLGQVFQIQNANRPEQYGYSHETGANVATNTIAFQECVNVSVNTSLTGSSYELDSLNIPSNREITGHAWTKLLINSSCILLNASKVTLNSFIIEDNNIVGKMLDVQDSDNITLNKVFFEGNGYNESTGAYEDGATNGAYFERCSVIRVNGGGVKDIRNTWGYTFVGVDDGIVDGATVENCARSGIQILNTNTNIKILNNTLINCKSGHEGGNAEDGYLTAYDGAIDLYGPDNENVTVYNNTLIDCGGSEIAGTSGTIGPLKCCGVRVGGSKDIKVHGNTIYSGDGLWAAFSSQARYEVINTDVDFYNNTVYLQGGASYFFRHMTGENVNFYGNVSRATTATAKYDTAVIQYREDVNSANISENKAYGFKVDGVEGWAAELNVTGVLFDSNGTGFTDVKIASNRIRVQGETLQLNHIDDFRVIDNTLTRDGSSVTVTVSDTCSNGRLTNNTVEYSGTYEDVNGNISIGSGATNVTESGTIQKGT